MDKNERLNKIDRDIHMARVASSAYNTYLKQYIQDQRILLFSDFENSDGTAENLQNIYSDLVAVNNLESNIKTVISTGNMAAEELNENRNTK